MIRPRAGWGLNGNVHVGIVILSVVHVLQTLRWAQKEAPVNDIRQNCEEATTSTTAVNLILEGMRKMQDELLSVRQGREEAAECSERNARKENYSFKRKGNELQHKFNDRVADKFAAAAAAISKVETTSSSSKALLDRATKELEEGVFRSGAWPLLSNLEDPRAEKIGQSTTNNSAEEQGGQHHKEVPRCISALEDLGRCKTRSAELPSTGAPPGAVHAAPQ